MSHQVLHVHIAVDHCTTQTDTIGSLSCHKTAKYSVSFGSGRTLSALQSKSCECKTTWSLFSWVCLLLESDNPLPEVSPCIVTPLQATCSFTSINNPLFT